MEKKNFLFYETPEMEVLNMNAEGFFCASGDIEGVDNIDDLNGGNDDPGF